MSTVTTTAPRRPIPAATGRHPVGRATGFAVLLAGVAAEAVGVIARAAGVPMEAGGFGAGQAEAIGVGAFAFGTVINVVIGGLLAAAFTRWARSPRRTFERVAVVLTALSMVPVVMASHTALSTKLTLAGAHLVVAVIAVPILARAVPAR
jgi:hypothetical protein